VLRCLSDAALWFFSAATGGVSTADGRLILSSALPLLGGRYRYVRSVGEGAFSQILVCDDTYSVDAENQRRDGCPSKVAIKVMNLKYTDIGAQELVMLRFLNKLGKRRAGSDSACFGNPFLSCAVLNGEGGRMQIATTAHASCVQPQRLTSTGTFAS
jgi:hypothetical protein